ncbi:ATP-binding cassette domain-containing protein [Allosalinactinospora lopnorensis]|uniref:ATP-binding cassette domain-containing protein n=1 Tax=Allosalinactinospora lopnorensis TaxID=1352348 RepID=UPI000623CE00|nr:ATP-binding cassette domain-containing protein [Allosalinactinospora lopnorensis]
MRRATGARVEAEGLTLHTGGGTVYDGVTFTARPGSLTAFQADSGGGRTALLLTLAGRMRPTSGSLHVDGYTLPAEGRRVRRITALGLCEGVNDLEERLRVHEHLSERLQLRLKPAGRSAREAALADAGLAEIDTSRRISELSMEQKRRLGVALALLDEPRLLLVDDADRGLSSHSQRRFWHTLDELAASGLTVVAACSDTRAAGEGATVLPLTRSGPESDPAPGDHRPGPPSRPAGAAAAPEASTGEEQA